jgi:hypothetical protein
MTDLTPLFCRIRWHRWAYRSEEDMVLPMRRQCRSCHKKQVMTYHHQGDDWEDEETQPLAALAGEEEKHEAKR